MKASELKCGDCFLYNEKIYFVPQNIYKPSPFIVSAINTGGDWEHIPFADEVKLITTKAHFTQRSLDCNTTYSELSYGAWFEFESCIYIKITEQQMFCLFSKKNEDKWKFYPADSCYPVHVKNEYILDFSEIDKIEV